MPLYDYHCDECDLDFQLLRPMAESHLLGECEKCKKLARRLMTFPAVKWFFGSVHYDRMNNYSPGNSSVQMKNDVQKKTYKGVKVDIPTKR